VTDSKIEKFKAFLFFRYVGRLDTPERN